MMNNIEKTTKHIVKQDFCFLTGADIGGGMGGGGAHPVPPSRTILCSFRSFANL
jgi:hypothetical protein